MFTYGVYIYIYAIYICIQYTNVYSTHTKQIYTIYTNIIQNTKYKNTNVQMQYPYNRQMYVYCTYIDGVSS